MMTMFAVAVVVAVLAVVVAMMMITVAAAVADLVGYVEAADADWVASNFELPLS